MNREPPYGALRTLGINLPGAKPIKSNGILAQNLSANALRPALKVIRHDPEHLLGTTMLL